MCKLVIRKYSVAFIWSLTFFLVVDGVCVCVEQTPNHTSCVAGIELLRRRLLRGMVLATALNEPCG